MLSKDLIKRFEEAFKKPEKINAEEYQKIIEVGASKASENVEKLTNRLLSLAFLNILVALGEIDKLNYLGLAEIGDKSLILMILLATISYVHYDLVITLSKFDQLSVIYKIIIKNRHMPLHNQRLSKYFLFPPSLYEYTYSSSNGIAPRLQSYLWLVEFIGILIVIPFGSEIIAFSNLITLALPPNPFQYWVFIAWSIITILLNIQTILTIITLLKVTADE